MLTHLIRKVIFYIKFSDFSVFSFCKKKVNIKKYFISLCDDYLEVDSNAVCY